ncbi:unnamed protein product, partial [Prorocentrum cordatum]
ELLYPQHGECLTHAPYVDDSSDPDGWTYGSSAARLATKRLGGRASNRVGDRYRQRLWRPLEAEEPEGSPPASPSRTSRSTRHLGAEPGQMDLERVQSSFWDAFKAVMSTRGISRIPMDPIAMLRRRSKDAERYEALAQRLPRWSDVDLLGELCVAALYSRAAYGFVARKGLFDSLVAGAQVFSLQKAVFDVSTDVDDATNKRAFLDIHARPVLGRPPPRAVEGRGHVLPHLRCRPRRRDEVDRRCRQGLHLNHGRPHRPRGQERAVP